MRRKKEKERERERRAADAPSRALRARSALQNAIQDVPHVPIQDDWYAYEDRYTLRSAGYYDPSSEAVRRDREGIMRAGGYMVEEAWERALRCAVAGLDITPLSSSSPVVPPPLTSGGDVVMTAV